MSKKQLALLAISGALAAAFAYMGNRDSASDFKRRAVRRPDLNLNAALSGAPSRAAASAAVPLPREAWGRGRQGQAPEASSSGECDLSALDAKFQKIEADCESHHAACYNDCEKIPHTPGHSYSGWRSCYDRSCLHKYFEKNCAGACQGEAEEKACMDDCLRKKSAVCAEACNKKYPAQILQSENKIMSCYDGCKEKTKKGSCEKGLLEDSHFHFEPDAENLELLNRRLEEAWPHCGIESYDKEDISKDVKNCAFKQSAFIDANAARLLLSGPHAFNPPSGPILPHYSRACILNEAAPTTFSSNHTDGFCQFFASVHSKITAAYEQSIKFMDSGAGSCEEQKAALVCLSGFLGRARPMALSLFKLPWAWRLHVWNENKKSNPGLQQRIKAAADSRNISMDTLKEECKGHGSLQGMFPELFEGSPAPAEPPADQEKESTESKGTGSA